MKKICHPFLIFLGLSGIMMASLEILGGKWRRFMKVLKKNAFDFCAGDCFSCSKRGIKNLSLLTITTKRKISNKYVPPDMGAIKLALELESQEKKNIQDMTDSELIEYERELMRLLDIHPHAQKNTEDDKDEN